MIERKIAVDTSRRSGLLFKVNEYQGRFGVYKVDGIILTTLKRIGEARSLEDAITLIRSYVGEHIRDLRVKPW